MFIVLLVVTFLISSSSQGTWTNYTNVNYIIDIAVEDNYT